MSARLNIENVGNDPANEAVSQGLMDSLSSRLTNLDVDQQSVWVVPTSEIRRLKVVDPGAALRQCKGKCGFALDALTRRGQLQSLCG